MLLFFALAAVLLGVSFALFHLPLRAVAVSVRRCGAAGLGLAALALAFPAAYMKLHRELSQLETTAAELIGVLPAAASVPDGRLSGDRAAVSAAQSADAAAKAASDARAICLNTIRVWAHQIKTPIAAMRLPAPERGQRLLRRGFSPISDASSSMWKWCSRISGWRARGRDYVFRDSEAR